MNFSELFQAVTLVLLSCLEEKIINHIFFNFFFTFSCPSRFFMALRIRFLKFSENKRQSIFNTEHQAHYSLKMLLYLNTTSPEKIDLLT